jgi:bis(5'-adenosyl)-triphosphatase
MPDTAIKPDAPCIFCSKAVIEKSFYSEGGFRAIYNIAPILPGHSLVIPNKHFDSLFELSDSELGEMMVFARRITTVLKSVFGCDGFDLTIQDGKSAGQTVPHLHLHIIPRKPHDMAIGEDWYGKIAGSERLMIDSEQRERLNDGEFDAVIARLKVATTTLLK